MNDEYTLLAQLIPEFDSIPNETPVQIQLTKGDISLLIRSIMQSNNTNDAIGSAVSKLINGAQVEEITHDLNMAAHMRHQSQSAINAFATSVIYKVLHGNQEA